MYIAYRYNVNYDFRKNYKKIIVSGESFYVVLRKYSDMKTWNFYHLNYWVCTL